MSARVATERVYRTLDGRYVPHGHEDAAFLAAGVGGALPADCEGFDATVAVVADDAPVVADDAEPEPEPEPEADEPEPEPEPEAPKKPAPKGKKS